MIALLIIVIMEKRSICQLARSLAQGGGEGNGICFPGWWLARTCSHHLTQALFQGFEAFAGLGGDGKDFLLWKAGLEGFEVELRFFEVDFVGDNQPFSFAEFFVVEAEFFSENLNVRDRVALIDAGSIHDKKEYGTAADVTEEVVSEADVLVRAFDESRYVCDGGAL